MIWNDRNMNYLDYDDNFTGYKIMHILKHQVVHLKYIHFQFVNHILIKLKIHFKEYI